MAEQKHITINAIPSEDKSIALSLALSVLKPRDLVRTKSISKFFYNESTTNPYRHDIYRKFYNLTDAEYASLGKDVIENFELITALIEKIYERVAAQRFVNNGQNPYKILLNLFINNLLNRELVQVCWQNPSLAAQVRAVDFLWKKIPTEERTKQKFGLSNLAGACIGFMAGIGKISRYIASSLLLIYNSGRPFSTLAILSSVVLCFLAFLGAVPPDFFYVEIDILLQIWPYLLAYTLVMLFLNLSYRDTFGVAELYSARTNPIQVLKNGLKNTLEFCLICPLKLLVSVGNSIRQGYYGGHKLAWKNLRDLTLYEDIPSIKKINSFDWIGLANSYRDYPIFFNKTCVEIADNFNQTYGTRLSQLRTNPETQERGLTWTDLDHKLEIKASGTTHLREITADDFLAEPENDHAAPQPIELVEFSQIHNLSSTTNDQTIDNSHFGNHHSQIRN